jgi:hypothetical protein
MNGKEASLGITSSTIKTPKPQPILKMNIQ